MTDKLKCYKGPNPPALISFAASLLRLKRDGLCRNSSDTFGTTLLNSTLQPEATCRLIPSRHSFPACDPDAR